MKYELTNMQSFLNEEHSYFSKKFRKYPSYWLSLILIIGLAVGLLTTSIICNTFTLVQQNIMLSVGLLLCVFIVLFIGIPATLRLILNCFFRIREREKNSGLKNLPLSYIPPPPNSPAPRWALKSFRETMAQPGTRLSSRTSP